MPAVCVFCRRHPVDPVWRPFCSDRCRLQDLARWADGSYRIPDESVTDDGDDDERPETQKAEDKT